MKGKTLLIRLAAVALCVALGAVMMVIGRGHTIYLDNKTLEDYQGQEYPSFERVNITVDGEEEVIKLRKRERDVATCLGQSFHMTLEITEKKGDEPRVEEIDLKLPYNLDGIIVNLPALMAGLPEEAWLTEFIPAPESEDSGEEPGVGDEFGMEGGEFGMEGDVGLEDEPIA